MVAFAAGTSRISSTTTRWRHSFATRSSSRRRDGADPPLYQGRRPQSIRLLQGPGIGHRSRSCPRDRAGSGRHGKHGQRRGRAGRYGCGGRPLYCYFRSPFGASGQDRPTPGLWQPGSGSRRLVRRRLRSLRARLRGIRLVQSKYRL